MELWFSRVDPKHHRFRAERPGLDTIDVVLNTRSFLLHDLAHYAVESHARAEQGFYGLLASGLSLDELRNPDSLDPDTLSRLMEIEKTVALLQSGFKHGAVSCSAGDARVLRNLWGAWSKAKQGQALYLRWPDPTPEVVA
jgi:hypothetical protein